MAYPGRTQSTRPAERGPSGCSHIRSGTDIRISDARTNPAKLTALVALGRLAFGVGLIVAPRRVASGWLGEVAARPDAQVAIRGLGARDVALSAGALAALGDGDRLRRWMLAAAACDLADVAVALATPAEKLPANARWGTVALGGGSAVAGLLAYATLDG